MAASEPLPEVLGLAEDKGFSTRRAALTRLGTEMSQQDVLALCDYLREGCKTDDSLTPDQKYVLVNEIQDALQEQKEPPPGFTETLLAVYRDRMQDEVVRDYSVQHLGSWYERAPDKRPIREALWEATSETGNSIAGTALLALSNISDSDPDRLAQTALRIVTVEQSGVPARMSALQVCSQLSVKEANPVARTIIAQPGNDVSLRISAIAALGSLGSAGDLSALQQLAEGTDLQMQPAARAALKRLQRELRGQK
jgi:HEAT repeat protein